MGCQENRSLLDLEEADYHGGAENELVNRLGDISMRTRSMNSDLTSGACILILFQGKSINKLDEMSRIAR